MSWFWACNNIARTRSSRLLQMSAGWEPGYLGWWVGVLLFWTCILKPAHLPWPGDLGTRDDPVDSDIAMHRGRRHSTERESCPAGGWSVQRHESPLRGWDGIFAEGLEIGYVPIITARMSRGDKRPRLLLAAPKSRPGYLTKTSWVDNILEHACKYVQH